MPTTDFATPQPGDLITADLLARVVTAIGALEDLASELSSRVSRLEHPGGPIKWPPSIVIDFPPDKIKPVFSKITAAVDKLGAGATDSDKFLAAYEVYVKNRDDVLSGLVTGDPGDPTPEEMLNVATMAGLPAAAGFQAVKSVDPVAAGRIDSMLSQRNTTLLGVQAAFDRTKIGG